MAKNGLNRVQLIGNIGQSPECSLHSDGKKKAKFTMATNKSYKDKKGELIQKTQWHTVVFWGKIAEIVNNYLTKGSYVFVEGELNTRKYTDSDGAEKYFTEILGNKLLILGGTEKKLDDLVIFPDEVSKDKDAV